MGTPLDLVTATAFGCAAVGAIVALGRCPRAGRRFWQLASAGFALLALDKPLRLLDRAHEGLHHLGFSDPPFLNGIDDLLLLVGAVIALAICLGYRTEIADSRPRCALLGVAAVLFVTALMIDALGPQGGRLPTLEQWLELGSALLLAAFAVRAAHESAAVGRISPGAGARLRRSPEEPHIAPARHRP